MLFQYAAGRHLSIKNNTLLRLNLANCIKSHDLKAQQMIDLINSFNICADIYKPPIHHKIIYHPGINLIRLNNRLYQEKKWGFDPGLLMLGDDVIIKGFFQSEKYFKDIENIIRDDLRLKADLPEKEMSPYLENIKASNSVSIHIRRKEYLKSKLHRVCSMGYILNAVNYIRERLNAPQFFVFSDDIDWCQKNININININDCSFVDLKQHRQNPIYDFNLMQLCKHQIISNSTFSWWAAWLNDHPGKIVVSPDRWFNDRKLNFQAMKDTVPEDWIKINV